MLHTCHIHERSWQANAAKSLLGFVRQASFVRLKECMHLIPSRTPTGTMVRNHGKWTLEVTLCYTLVISMKGVDKNQPCLDTRTLEVTLCYTLVISMKGVDKNHGKSLTSTLEVNLLECTCNKHVWNWPDLILVMWLLTKISCYFLWIHAWDLIFNRDLG